MSFEQIFQVLTIAASVCGVAALTIGFLVVRRARAEEAVPRPPSPIEDVAELSGALRGLSRFIAGH